MVMTSEAVAEAGTLGGLGILAGSGPLPLEIAEAAIASGRPVHIVGIEGFAAAAIAGYPHQWVNLGQVGRMIRGFRQAGCADIVIAGGMRRPNLWKLKLDAGFFRCIGTVLKLTRGGDDSVLRRVVRFFELQGFNVQGAHEIAQHLLAPAGILGRVEPSEPHHAAIERGVALIGALGVFDVGQAVLVSAARVIAVEGVGGTDAMLADMAKILGQCAERTAHGGVLVKLPKPGQEMRVDLPVIGPLTIDGIARAGLAGVAVRAGQSLILERQETIRRADASGVFVTAIEVPDPPATVPADRARYLDEHDVPLAVLGRRAPTPGERRDVAIGRALMRALAEYEAGQAAVIADQHVRAIDAALPIEAIVRPAAAGNDWGRRLFKKRIGVLVVRRPELILNLEHAASDEDPRPADFQWIAEAGLAGIACVEGTIPEQLLAAVAREANERGLFVMAPETPA
jgi:UDP-2,3-diacylglucosamine hydrolase